MSLVLLCRRFVQVLDFRLMDLVGAMALIAPLALEAKATLGARALVRAVVHDGRLCGNGKFSCGGRPEGRGKLGLEGKAVLV